MTQKASPFPGDRRKFARVSCLIEVSSDDFGQGQILNISIGGAFIYVPGMVDELPDTIDLSFRLPGHPSSIQVSAQLVELIHLVPDATGIRVEFLHLQEKVAHELQGFVLQQIVDEMAGLMEQSPVPLETGRVQVVTGFLKVREVLEELLGGARVLGGMIFQRDSMGFREFELDAIEDDHVVISLLNPSVSRPTENDRIHLFIDTEQLNYYFYSVVYERNGPLLRVYVPDQLVTYSRRRSQRRTPEPAMTVEIPLPYPPGKQLDLVVLNISREGLAYSVDPDQSYFLPGTPIPEMVVRSRTGQRDFYSSSRVVHVTPVADDSGTTRYLKVGVDFGIGSREMRQVIRPAYLPSDRNGALSRLLQMILSFMRRSSMELPQIDHSAFVDLVRFQNSRKEELVGILNSTNETRTKRIVAPVVIISPPFGKRKESMTGLAMALIDNFKRRGSDIVVLRYDGVRCPGESYPSVESDRDAAEPFRSTLSQAVDDVSAVLDFVYENERFTPNVVILVSVGLQAVAGRRAVAMDRGRRIQKWIGITPAVCAQEFLLNESGGVDLARLVMSGEHVGQGSIYGIPMDMDHFCTDAIRSGLASHEDATAESARIPVPISWISGEHDSLVPLPAARDFISVPTTAPREHVTLPVGHSPFRGPGATLVSRELNSIVWRFVFHERIEPLDPDRHFLKKMKAAEWGRLDLDSASDPLSFWKDQLFTRPGGRLRCQALVGSQEYRAFLKKQVELLRVEPGHRVADMGCGSGALSEMLLQTMGPRKASRLERLHLVDLVPDVLKIARSRLRSLGETRGTTMPPMDLHALNLEIHAVRTVRRLLTGEYFGYGVLDGVLDGLSFNSLEMWIANQDWRLHDILRGKIPTVNDRTYLKANVPPEELDVILDFNRISRFVHGEWIAGDLSPRGARKVEQGISPRLEDLGLSRIGVFPSNGDEQLPFEDMQLDAIAASLLLPYIRNPVETVREFHRLLVPGGRLVVSAMAPDSDPGVVLRGAMLELDKRGSFSGEHDVALAKQDLRSCKGRMAMLQNLAEQGRFNSLGLDDLKNLLEQAGFVQVKTVSSLGRPPQAGIAVGLR